eukprot:GGOE01050203.1.p3 GENE.GGOE01050203.1~~GGOE01050203.1.p3  ORF type:complete len:118 (+),score=26.16 GGOE01050203.1:180-533(+)
MPLHQLAQCYFLGGIMPGTVGAAMEITDEVRDLCLALRDAAEKKAQAAGWNGLFVTFEPISFATQVVAGTNYLVKVAISEGKYAHIRIFRPLPCNGGEPEVHGVQVDKKLEDPLHHF